MLTTLTLILGLTAGTCISRVVECPHTQEIVGGDDAKRGDNPHMCSLQYEGRHWCGSAIISGEWLLTAAHCLKGYVSDYVDL